MTGEYAVLDGAISLAIPTRFGQSLMVRQNNSGVISWKSLEKSSTWFQSDFDLEQLNPVNDQDEMSEDKEVSGQLGNILRNARILNPEFLSNASGLEVQTEIDFNRKWGLGTSSTLINNVSQWAKIDPYKLLATTFGGSGYDIACANHSRPILYQVHNDSKKISEVDFKPEFTEHIYFVYLNKKQDSRAGITAYRQKIFDRDLLVQRISEISLSMVNVKNIEEFKQLIREHETLLSKILELPTVQESIFPDFQGAIKSLGAWGGDFVMAASLTEGPDYFRTRGYHTIFSYKEIILQ